MIKNLPSSAGDVVSIPDRGTRILHATGQLQKPAHRNKDQSQPQKKKRKKHSSHDEKLYYCNHINLGAYRSICIPECILLNST